MMRLPDGAKIISAKIYWHDRVIELSDYDLQKLQMGEELKFKFCDDWSEETVTWNNGEVEDAEYYRVCTKKLAKLIKKGKEICDNLGIDLDEL
jgi:hypothetical protein